MIIFKKIRVFKTIFLIVTCVFTGCMFSTDNDVAKPQGDARWIFLIHFAVDNDLSYLKDNLRILSDNLKKLENIKNSAGDSIEILILMDGYNNDILKKGRICPYNDGYYRLSGIDFKDDCTVKLSEVNSGSTADIKAFFDWAAAIRKGEKYVYTIHNHGGGFADYSKTGEFSSRGIGYDVNQNYNSLTHNEIGELTAYLSDKIGNKIDLFYLAACLMGGIEMIYEVKDSVKYVVSSEELLFGEKWFFDAFQDVVNKPDISIPELGKSICESGYIFLKNFSISIGEPVPYTLSVIDCSRIDLLSDAINSFAERALFILDSDNSKAQLFNKAANDSYSMYFDEKSFYSIDLGRYFDNIHSNVLMDDDVRIKASNAAKLLSESIVYNYTSENLNTSGLSIFHNSWNSKEQYSSKLYREILSFGNNKWADYVKKMEDLSGD